MYLGGSLAPSIQIVGSLLIPPGWQHWPIKWSEHNSNGFDRLENLTFWTISILGIDHYCCMSLENESFQVLKKKSNVVNMSKIDICLRASCAKLVCFICKKCFSFVSKMSYASNGTTYPYFVKARFWGFYESQWNFSLVQLRVAKLEHKLYLITWSLAYKFSKVLLSFNWVNFVCLGYDLLYLKFFCRLSRV